MNSPADTQQESGSTEDLIASTFDELNEQSDGDLIPETGVELETETTTAAPETAEVAEEASETVAEEAAPETELAEEVKAAEESEYNEPAPERWTQDIQDYYNGLDPKGKEIFLDRLHKPMQRSHTKAMQEVAEMRKGLEPVLAIMKQYTPQLESMGVDPMQALQTQIAWVAHLNTVGAEKGLDDMRAAYGVGTPKPRGQEEYLTPQERATKQSVEALQQQVAGMQANTKQTSDNALAEQQQNYKQEIHTSLQTFINEKTDDGKLAHPHVEKVASGIAGIIRGGLIPKADEYGNPRPLRDQIAQAYGMACNLDSSIRTPSPSTRQAPLIKAALDAEVVTKTPAGHVSTTDDTPLDSFIEKTWEELNRKSA